MKLGPLLLVALSCLFGSAGCRSPGNRGYLIVHTEMFTHGSGENFHDLYEPYDILDQAGNVVRHVENHWPSMEESGPTRVGLPPGSYVIRAWPAQGEVKIPVVVQLGKLTTVNAR